MKILITGSDGQLGKELTKQLLNNPLIESLVLTDKNNLDVTSFLQVEKKIMDEKPDIIINCAAHTAVDKCEEDLENAYNINAKGPKNLAIVSNKINSRIIHISTDYVFDGEATSSYIESDQTNPQSVYGSTKLAGENFIIENNPKHFIVRTAWLYGDGHNFVNTMLRLAESNKQLKIVNDQIGSPTSTNELTKAIIQLLPSDKYGIYHGTCEGFCSWYDFAKKIFELKGIDIDLIPCSSEEYPQKAQRPNYSVLENKNFKANFDYTFKHWEEALRDYLR